MALQKLSTKSKQPKFLSIKEILEQNADFRTKALYSKKLKKNATKIKI